jgi:hypothetical protein
VSPVYSHTQIGYVTIAALAFGAIAPLAAATAQPLRVAMLCVSGLLLLCLVLFSSLTTKVYPDRVTCHFGFGVIHRSIALADLASVAVVRNSWLSGWGIRLTATGWLWNVSGLDAVELVFRDGHRFRIGSDEAPALCSALQSQLPRAPAQP